jgi:hypothetical protein
VKESGNETSAIIDVFVCTIYRYTHHSERMLVEAKYFLQQSKPRIDLTERFVDCCDD